MRFLVAAAVLAGVLLPGYANAVQVTAYGSDTPMNVMKGDNLIDGPHTINCKSPSGCLLTVSLYAVNATDPSPKSCIFVDGQDVTPKCGYDDIVAPSKQGFRQVSQGTHTVEMHELCDQPGQVLAWETEYALYRKP
ncbi:MAG TPA: hypothetical protein VHU23_12665 [Rhizomicrobium sp.]|jgi:hypothetical protein|nr:hypothetical protein [Rhizomicrobium sp.]